MWNNVVGDNIARAIRMKSIMFCVIMIGIFMVVCANHRYLYNVFAGPFAIDTPTLLSISEPRDLRKYFVIVKGDKTFDSGFADYEGRRNKKTGEVKEEKVIGYYLLLFVGDKVLPVRCPIATTATSFEGALEPVDDGPTRQFMDEINRNHPYLAAHTLPMILNVSEFKSGGYIALAFLTPLLLICLWNLKLARDRSIDYNMHPIAKSLSKHGKPADIARAIDQEFKLAQVTSTLGPVTITESWLLIRWTADLRCISFNDLTWAYKKRTTHCIWFVPYRFSNDLILCTSDGKHSDVSMSEKEIEKALGVIYQRAPWVIIGFTDELKQAWDRNPKQMAETVTARREQLRRNAEEPVEIT